MKLKLGRATAMNSMQKNHTTQPVMAAASYFFYFTISSYQGWRS
jgi:hypothetical protein